MTGEDENHRLENASDENRYEAQQNISAAPAAYTVRRGKARKAEHSLRSWLLMSPAARLRGSAADVDSES